MINRKIHSITLESESNFIDSDFLPTLKLMYWNTADYIRDYNITRFAKRPFAGAKRFMFVLGKDKHDFPVFVCTTEPDVLLCVSYCKEFGIVGKNTKKFSLWVR